MYLHIHPIFLTDLERMYYYLCFESRLNFMGNTSLVQVPARKMMFYKALDTIVYPETEGYNSWCEKASSVHPEFGRIFYHVEGYSSGARSFIRFCKNVSIHATGELQDDMLRTATLLLSVWPDFPFLIHKVMVQKGYYNIRPQYVIPLSSALAFSFLCIAEQKNDDWYWRCLSLRIIDLVGWPIPLLEQPLVWARKACGQFPYNLKSGLSFTVLTKHANIFISCDDTLSLFTRLAQNVFLSQSL
ncbi:hypothetical protein AKJ16_DCAP25870 [Drosera capensis]